MVKKGYEFYDQDDIFNTYMSHRKRQQNPNDTIEQPIIEYLLKNCLKGHVLDLGCGDGGFSTYCLSHGADHYTGLEGSKKMFERAKLTHQNTRTTFIHHDIETWDYPIEAHDLITSRLVLHYIKDLKAVFNQIYQTLKKGGCFIFSVEHPIMTASPPETEGRKTNRTVDHYFDTGARDHHWLGDHVIKYHRTIDDYFHLLSESGFKIDDLKESKPEKKYFDSEEEYQRRMRIPLFLLFKAKKQ